MSGQNQLDTLGLHVRTANDIIDELTEAMKTIYGTDINVDPTSPDGQLINIYAQAAADMLENLVATYNSFNPESAYGAILDHRAAINGLTRQGATYTYVGVLVTVTKGVNLVGLDGDPTASAFTVEDDAGNQFYLNASYTFSIAGAATLSFRSKDIGAVLITNNTITNIVTVVDGASTVNNAAGATVQGIDGESDADLRIRRLKSFMLAGTGSSDAIQAALLAADSVTDALVVVNDTVGTVDTILAHSIWAIVENGAEADIGQVIYEKKPMGCGMKGSSTYNVSRPNSLSFTASFDRPLYTPLYIRFTLTTKDGSTPDTAYVKTEMATALANFYKLGQQAIASELVGIILAIETEGIVTSLGVSDDGITYSETELTSTKQYKFTVASTNITIT